MAINFLNNVNLNKNQLEQARIENLATDPASGVLGQIIFNTTSNVLKVCTVASPTAAVFSEVGGGVSTVSTNNSTFVNLANVGTAINPSLTASLSATGTPDNTKYLRGDNTWSAISGIYDWTLSADSGSINPVTSGTTVTIAGANDISTVISLGTLFVNHDGVIRTDTTSTVSPSFGGTFTAIDSVTSSVTGHITALNLKTVTLPTPTPASITLTGDVTGSGTTSIATTVATNVLYVYNFNTSAIVTAAEGIVNNDNDTTLPTSAAVKAYVDASVAGGLIYQGGYNAATNTPNLDSPPTIAGIKTGWTYTVTADGLFFGTEQLRVGDVLIAEIDGPTTLADWTVVQSNIDLASLTQIGIGNVNAGDGVGVTYAAGTATVTNTDKGSSQNIFKNIAVSGQSTIVADTNNDTLTIAAGSGITLTTDAGTDTVTIEATQVGRSFTNTNPTTSATYTITSGTHGLGTDSSVIMVQLVQVSTGETVFSDVTRGASGLITITFATAQTAGSIRALLQKIG